MKNKPYLQGPIEVYAHKLDEAIGQLQHSNFNCVNDIEHNIQQQTIVDTAGKYVLAKSCSQAEADGDT